MFLRYQDGFNTYTGLPEDQKTFDNVRSWPKNEVFKSKPHIVAVDVRNKKLKSTNDGYVKQ